MAVATSPPLPPPPPPLLSFSEIPPWHQDNEHIRHGYRRTTGSARLCLASWSPRQLHNESLNIYTHLMPALVFLYLLFTFPSYLQTHYPQVTSADQWVFGIFLGSAAVCFGLSAGFHTLLCHSERVGRLWLMLDYAGIVVLTLGDFVSGVYVGFWCEKEFRWAYWGMIVFLGCLTLLLLVNPRLQGRRWRNARAGAFVATGLSGFAPLGHGIKLFGVEQMNRQSGMPYYLMEGGLLVLGVAFYVTRAPESLRPGRFDIWGNSHTIFHILVVVATAVQFYGILDAYDYNYKHRICGPNSY